MPKYTVTVKWEMMGEFEVEADSLEEAIDKVGDEEPPFNTLPPDGDYVDGSFELVRDCCHKS